MYSQDDEDSDFDDCQVQVESRFQQRPSRGAAMPERVNDRKLFVGGLSEETKEEDLVNYFIKFGSIEYANVKVDDNTGISKGFGFVLFHSAESIAQVTAAGEHVINNKSVVAQAARERVGKIYVTGITNEITAEDIKSYFGQFGHIVGIEMPLDRRTNQHKKFCFVLFQSEDVARNVIKMPGHSIKNIQVHIKRPMSKTNQEYNRRSSGQSSSAQSFFAQRSYAQRSHAQRSYAQRSFAQRPFVQRSSVQRPFAQRSYAQRSSAQRPFAQRSSAQRPFVQRSSVQRPFAQRSFAQRNADAFGQNWGQTYGNQPYGESGYNHQQGYGGMYGAAYTGYETYNPSYNTYDTSGYKGYTNVLENVVNGKYIGPPTDRSDTSGYKSYTNVLENILNGKYVGPPTDRSDTSGYKGYTNVLENMVNGKYIGPPTDRSAPGEGSRGGRGGTFKGRGNRFQQF